jgi:hypothetical protein
VQTWKAKIGMRIKIDALIFLEVATRRPLFHKFGFHLDQSQHAHFARSIAEIKRSSSANYIFQCLLQKKRGHSPRISRFVPTKVSSLDTSAAPRLSASVSFVPES